MRADIENAEITKKELSLLINKSQGYISSILRTGICPLSTYKEINKVLEEHKREAKSLATKKSGTRHSYTEKRICCDGQEIRRKIKQNHKTIIAFAEQLGVHESTFRDWLDNGMMPETILAKVNELLDMKPKKEAGQIDGQTCIEDFIESPKTESTVVCSIRNIRNSIQSIRIEYQIIFDELGGIMDTLMEGGL